MTLTLCESHMRISEQHYYWSFVVIQCELKIEFGLQSSFWFSGKELLCVLLTSMAWGTPHRHESNTSGLLAIIECSECKQLLQQTGCRWHSACGVDTICIICIIHCMSPTSPLQKHATLLWWQSCEVRQCFKSIITVSGAKRFDCTNTLLHQNQSWKCALHVVWLNMWLISKEGNFYVHPSLLKLFCLFLSHKWEPVTSDTTSASNNVSRHYRYHKTPFWSAIL